MAKTDYTEDSLKKEIRDSFKVSLSKDHVSEKFGYWCGYLRSLRDTDTISKSLFDSASGYVTVIRGETLDRMRY